jgi:hypothetical protein
MQIYQHVLNAYMSAQKSGKKVELPASIDKIVQILSEVPDSQVVPVITLIVTCEQDARVLDAVHKLMRDRGLVGGKAGGAKGGGGGGGGAQQRNPEMAPMAGDE